MQQLLIAGAPPQTPPVLIPADQFREGQNGYEMPNIGGMLKVNNGNVATIAIGLILSASVGGLVMRWLPAVGKWGTVIAGLVIMYFAKTAKPVIRDIGIGVLLGGLASVFSGLGGSLGGILDGIGGNGMNEPMPPMAEDRMTYGGTDGVYPVNPDRRVFQ